jgi:hypothetical protein
MEILILCVFCVACGMVLGWAARAAFGYRVPDTWDGTDRGGRDPRDDH